jgi:hypothetical protein
MWVYLLGEANGAEVVKVGRTDQPTVASRIKTINGDQHSDERFVLLAAMRGEARAERAILRYFAEHLEPRGSHREYLRAVEPVVGYVIWLRAQHFVSVDPTDTEDLVMAEDVNGWVPREDRRLPRPPDTTDALFSPHLQLSGPLAGTAWDWLPDPMASYQDYFTPPDIVARAWRAMGGIDLDAASHFLANKRLVENGIRIAEYFTRGHSAFDHDWHGRVWLNPPYGENLPWFERMGAELDSGRVTQVCMISPMWAFATVQAQPYMSRAAAMVVLSPTPKFHNPGDPTRTGTNNPHAVVYWGDNPAGFLTAFADVAIPCLIGVTTMEENTE